MKRFLLGLGWFVLLWIGTMFACGFVIGLTTAGNPGQAAKAGNAFAEHYNGLVMLAALVVSVAGTATGKLPGTAKEKPADHAGAETASRPEIA